MRLSSASARRCARRVPEASMPSFLNEALLRPRAFSRLRPCSVSSIGRSSVPASRRLTEASRKVKPVCAFLLARPGVGARTDTESGARRVGPLMPRSRSPASRARPYSRGSSLRSEAPLSAQRALERASRGQGSLSTERRRSRHAHEHTLPTIGIRLYVRGGPHLACCDCARGALVMAPSARVRSARAGSEHAGALPLPRSGSAS